MKPFLFMSFPIFMMFKNGAFTLRPLEGAK